MDDKKELDLSSYAETYKVTNVQITRTGIHVTASYGRGKPVTRHFRNKNEAELWLKKSRAFIKPKFRQIIENGTITIPQNNPKKKTNRTKNDKRNAALNHRSSSGLLPHSPIAHKAKPEKPNIGVTVATVSYNKVVTIKVGTIVFHDFDDAIKYVRTTETYQKERLNLLIPKRNNWYKEIWIPRILKIVRDYEEERIPFTELFYRMNSYYSKEFTEEEALDILELCNNAVIRLEEKGEDGNKLAKGIYYSTITKKQKTDTIPKRQILPQPQVNDANDENYDFESEYRRLIDSNFNTIQKDIYVGLDFGTSFTKVAYHYTPGDRGIFLFGDSPFKPTVVYYNETNKKLSFFRRSPDDRQIQFFKATIVKDREQYAELRYNNVLLPSPVIQRDFELLCSVFFISNILLFVRHKLNEVFSFDANLYVAMGIPLFGYNTQTIYNKALHAGLYIADKVTDPSLLPIEKVYELYTESMASFNDALYTGFPNRFQHCTIPELFTESLYLLNKRTYAPGYYYIVDIGGGTSDFAFIHKDNSSTDSRFDYFCPSAVVAKLGNEVRKACSTSVQYANAYRDEFGLKYRTTIAKGKFGLDLHGHMEITQLLFGGGSIDPSNYYQNNKSVFTSGLHSISCHVSSRTDDFYDNTFIPPELNLSPEDKQRLIIATQLANPETSDSFLKAGPEQYDHTPKPERKTMDISERYPSQYDDIN